MTTRTASNTRRTLPDMHTPADQWLTFAEWESHQSHYMRFDREDTEIDSMIVVPYTYCPNVATLLDQSNHAAILAALEAADPTGDDYAVRQHSHWATPYEMILVAPHSTAFDAMDRTLAALADYPVLDESDFSERESEMAFENVRDAVRGLTFECQGDAIDSDTVAADMLEWYHNHGNWGFLESPEDRSVRDSERDQCLEALGWTLGDDDVYRRLA